MLVMMIIEKGKQQISIIFDCERQEFRTRVKMHEFLKLKRGFSTRVLKPCSENV